MPTTDRWTGAYPAEVAKTERYSKGEFYFLRNKAGEAYAYNTLGVNALAIYLMVTSNKDRYRLTIASTGINGNPLPRGMSRSSFTRAIQELKECGFMILDESGNYWHFYDIPQDIEFEKSPTEEVEVFKSVPHE